MKRLIFLGLALCFLGCGCSNDSSPSSSVQSLPSAESSLSSALISSEPLAAKPSEEQREEMEQLLPFAKLLTQQIARTIFVYSKFSDGTGFVPDEIGIENFVIYTLFFIDNEAHLYHDCVYKDSGYWHFPKENAQRVAKEVFGIEDWSFKLGEDLSYNEETKEFTIISGFDIGNGFECNDMETSIDSEHLEITVTYELTTSSQFPDMEILGIYDTKFAVQTNQDASLYLRYIGTKAHS